MVAIRKRSQHFESACGTRLAQCHGCKKKGPRKDPKAQSLIVSGSGRQWLMRHGDSYPYPEFHLGSPPSMAAMAFMNVYALQSL
ncbi:hypothetical protein SDJN02_24485, partial [Cucurbita argyrosperma subsp. argyrosperma]